MHLSFQEWLILTRLILPWTKHYIDFSKYVTSHLMPGISLYLSAWRNQGLFPVKLFHWLRCPQIFVLVTICNKLNQLARRFFFYSLPFSLPTTLECSNYFFPVLLPRGQRAFSGHWFFSRHLCWKSLGQFSSILHISRPLYARGDVAYSLQCWLFLQNHSNSYALMYIWILRATL